MQYTLITGSGRRIGAAIARYLHAQGYFVVIHANETNADAMVSELNHLRPNSAGLVYANLLVAEDRKCMVDEVSAMIPKLDLLAHNASSFIADEILDNHSRQMQFELNASVPYELSELFKPQLLKSDAASVIMIGDIHARLPLTGYSHYCASKAALLAYSKQLAKSFAPDIRVNAINPGAIMWPENKNALDESIQQKIISQTALQRHGVPLDIARAVHAFASMPFVTGQELAVDGGRQLKHS